MSEPPRLPLILAAIAPFAAGYFASYLFRVVNGAIAPELIAEFALDNTHLGLLTSAYLYAFMAFQLPLGLLLDRFGPRRVQAALLSIAAFGALGFAFASTMAELAAARALIGFGLCGGLMAAFKANALWLPKAKLALGNSLVLACGALGFAAGTAPAYALAAAIGWRAMFVGMAGMTALIALAILIVVPRGRPGPPATIRPWRHEIADYRRVFGDSRFWRIALMVAAISGTFIAVQSLWAIRWMSDVAGLDARQGANEMLAMAWAFALGAVATGVIADRLQKRGIGIPVMVCTGFVAFAASQFALIAGWPWSYTPIWILFGAAGQIANLGYASLVEHFGRDTAGRAQSAANLLLFLASAIFQSGIGWLLDRTQTIGRLSIADGYRVTFAILLLLQVAAILYYAWPRRKGGTT